MLSKNQLASLPSEVGALEALEELHLDGNQLSALPRELALLPALRLINLEGNPLDGSLPGAAHSFLDVWKTGNAGANGTAAAPAKGLASEMSTLSISPALRLDMEARTVAILGYLRDGMDPAQVFQLQKKKKAIEQARLKRELQQLRDSASLAPLLKAVEGAREKDLEVPREVEELMGCLTELKAACGARDEPRLTKGLEEWRRLTNRWEGPGVGGEVESALLLQKELRRTHMAEDFNRRMRESTVIASSRSAGRLGEPSAASVGGPEASYSRPGAVPPPAIPSVPSIELKKQLTHGTWIAAKEAAKRREEERIRRMLSEQSKKEREAKKRRNVAGRTLDDRERGWPSRIVEEPVPGMYGSNVDRIKMARQLNYTGVLKKDRDHPAGSGSGGERRRSTPLGAVAESEKQEAA